jgi:pimeloyl-ACP methyl ester carboxylesterase
MAHVLKTIELSTRVQIPYVEQGDQSGIPVVFLHGFLDSWQSFAYVLPHLPPTIHAFALTQRGHGNASRPEEGYSIVHFADDLKAFMDAVNLPKAVIVGHSMGSAVAQRFAIDRPERARGLVLIGASSHLAGSPETHKFWDSTVSKLTDPVEEAQVRQMTEAMLVQPVPPEVLDTALHEGIKVPAFVWRAVFESRWRGEGDFSQELGLIQAPTLIVWGDQDVRYPRADQETLARAIPGAQFIAYHGVGHLLHWEEPLRFAFDLVNFIEEITNRGP